MTGLLNVGPVVDSEAEDEMAGGAILDEQDVLASRASADGVQLPDFSGLSVAELFDADAMLKADAQGLRATAVAKETQRGGVVLEWYNRGRAELKKALPSSDIIDNLRFTNVNFGTSPDGEVFAIFHFPKVQVIDGVSVNLGDMFYGRVEFRVGLDEVICYLPLGRFERSPNEDHEDGCEREVCGIRERIVNECPD